MDEFYVDNRGYQKLLEEVEKAERKLKDHRKTRGDSYSSSAGDGWHDNFDFEEMERQERLLNGDLQIKQEKQPLYGCFSCLAAIIWSTLSRSNRYWFPIGELTQIRRPSWEIKANLFFSVLLLISNNFNK